MSLSPQKQEILQLLLLNDEPLKAADIAKETKKEFQPTMGHLLGLIRNGYVTTPQKGQYIITAKGKQALGIPQTTKEQAITILSYAPHDKAFNFYAAVGKPLNLHAHSLRDFCNKLERADIASIEFHVKRGDFEAWFKGLGDEELSHKTALIRQKNIVGEDLRRQLRGIVEQRYLELAKLAGQPIPTE
ncbi:MAG: hypothetical protein NWE98_11325 [Candidatus Bathyarchaeota archaeon]|nr:hypothetical protein [Candidatus Bathyarchaeota archaeon]